MAKYGTFKYGTQKYGRYSISTGADLSQLKNYRLRTVNTNGESRPIISQGLTLNGLGGSVKVRLRADNGSWVYSQAESIPKQVDALRIRAVSSTGITSPWIESVTGTIRRKGS